jgi:SAM-dependent methyltransferase
MSIINKMINIPIATSLIAIFLLIKLAQRRNLTTNLGAPYVPLEPHVVDKIMKLAKIKPGDVYYDLGSGDGRMVIAAALLGAKAYGVEIDRARVWYSRFCIFIFGLGKRAKIIHQDIFDINLSSANVVTIYLLQETNEKIFKKLTQELKPNTRVVSAAFSFPKWKPVTIDPNGPIYGPLYLYHLNHKPKTPRKIK